MTNPGHSGDQRGEHGGAMDKLKSVWREAVGSRDDEETRADGRADGREGRPEPSGTAHPADVRPEMSARNASGMQPAGADAGTGPVAQQHPQHGTPQQAGPGSVPRQQHASPAPERVPEEQTVAAGAPAWRGGQAPPAPATDDRAYGDRAQQQAPRQAAAPAQPAVPHQAGAAPASPEERSAPTQAAPAQSAPAQSAPPPRPGTGGTDTDDRRAGGEPVNQPDDSSAAAEPDTTDDADNVATDKPRGRHELFDAQGKPSSGGTATAGAATAAGMAGAASGTRTETDGEPAEATATDGRAGATARPESDGAAPGTTSAAGSAGGQDVPADPDRFVPAERAKGFANRWAELKGDFVDEPRDAVRKADALVGDVLDEISKVFTEQRSRLEHDLDTDSTSTEDLRQAMHRYRKFFERLLNI